MNNEIQSRTDWNGGTLTNVRLHDIKEQLKYAAVTRQLDMWRTLLERMNHELYGFQTEAEQKENLEILKKLAEDINKHELRMRNPRVYLKTIPPSLINSLNELEYKLDKTFHKSGLQTALVDDPGGSF